MTILVYTQKDCVPCRYTKKFMAANNIAYTEVDVDEAGVREKLLAQGHRSVPVVVTHNDSWSGYRREKLMDLRDSLRRSDG